MAKLRLSRTWRLGPETTGLIQPAFYPELPVVSVRPPLHLEVGGKPVPELLTSLVTARAGPGDLALTSGGNAYADEIPTNRVCPALSREDYGVPRRGRPPKWLVAQRR